jgi:hypothetical protein
MQVSTLPQCKVPGCSSPGNRRTLMCRAHWRLVPADLASSVLRADASVVLTKHTFNGPARRKHAKAVEAAVQAVIDITSTTPLSITSGKDIA